MSQRDTIHPTLHDGPAEVSSNPQASLIRDPFDVEVDQEALRASALRQARWLVDFYRITPQELLEDAPFAPKIEPVAAPAPIKYRHPVTGQTWDGLGAHPEWMRQALLQDGYRVAELRVEDPPGQDAPEF